MKMAVRIPGFAQLRMMWRILKSLNRIAGALERAYPVPVKVESKADIIEVSEELDTTELMSVRDGIVPWDIDELQEG